MIIITFELYPQSGQDDNPKEYSIIDELIDESWTGSGTLMGQEAIFSMDWQRVLGNKFIKLEFQNERKTKDNEPIVFRATAFYKFVNDSTVVGNWFDNRGITFPLKGNIRENELTIKWGDDETEKGKTIYYFIKDNNKVVVEDFVMTNDKYFKFGNATYFTKD